MPSANGYELEVNGHTLTAAWAAPFYVLALGYPEDGDEPMLVHHETEQDARSGLKCWQGETVLLDADFERVS